jgi:hypothetical protein
MSSIEIITAVPPRALWRRLWRSAGTLLGIAFTLVGLALFVPLFIALVMGLTSPSSVNLQAAFVPRFLIAYGAGVVFLLVGRRLRTGRRDVVLFLRRFGFRDASRALTLAVGTAVGKRWRLVTLDDAAIAPVGIRATTKWFWRLAALVLVVLAIGGCLWAAYWIEGGGLLSEMGRAMESARPARTGNIIADIMGTLVVALVVGMVVGIVSLFAILVPVGVAGSLGMFSLASARAVAAAESAKAAVVARQEDVAPTVTRTLRRARRILAPKLVVVRVVDALWQQVVGAFAARVAVVLVDVSEPGPGLEWELRTLAEAGVPRLLVGALANVADLAATAAPDTPRARLKELVRGERVLAYVSRDQRHQRAFAAALHSLLESPGRARTLDKGRGAG